MRNPFKRKSLPVGVPVFLHILDDGTPYVLYPEKITEEQQSYVAQWITQAEALADLRAFQRYAFMTNGKA